MRYLYALFHLNIVYLLFGGNKQKSDEKLVKKCYCVLKSLFLSKG